MVCSLSFHIKVDYRTLIIRSQPCHRPIQDHVATASVFTVREVMKTAGRYTVGHNVSDNYVTKSLEAAIDSNQVMYAGEGWLTTRTARLKELQLIKDVKEHQLHNWHILGLGSEVLSKRAFADEKQRLIAKDLVNNPTRLSILVSNAREDSADFYQRFEQLSSGSVTTKHLFPFKASAEKFEASIELKTNNLYGFMKYADKLIQEQASNPHIGSRPYLWVIHQAEKLSTAEVQEILDKSKALNTQVHFVRQAQETASRKPGDPTQYLQKNCPTYYLDEAKQVDITLKVNQTFSKLEAAGAIELNPERESRVQQSMDWLVKQDLKESSVFVATNTEKELMNTEVRETLKTNGQLKESDFETLRLKPIFLTVQEKSCASSYVEGDRLLFKRNNLGESFQRGDYWRIQGVNTKDNTLTLGNGEQSHTLALGKTTASGIEVFNPQRSELAIGDQIVLRPAIKQTSSLQGRVEILGIDKDNQTLSTSQGLLDLSKPSNSHWDYAYCQTLL